MRRLSFALALAALLAACSHSASTVVGPPSSPHADTITFADPTASANPGQLRFSLARSSTSNVPASADSALIRITNAASAFDHIYPVDIPAPGTQTVVNAHVPADTGYVVSIIAFHGGNVLDAVGSTYGEDTTITVLPEGGPVYTGTPVLVAMTPAPLTLEFSIANGTHVTAGEHISWFTTIDGAPNIWDRVSSNWGCDLDPAGMCSTPSYLALVPNTPGPWTLNATYYADWGDHTFAVSADPVTITIDQGSGEIIITFDKHHQAR